LYTIFVRRLKINRAKDVHCVFILRLSAPMRTVIIVKFYEQLNI
jgi:hypothetical protein